MQQNEINKFSTFGSTWILTIIFAILKMTGIVNWSWIIVFIPVMITATVWVIVILAILIIGSFIKFIKKKN